MNELKAIIIEDEANSKRLLKGILKESCPNVHIVGSADSVEAAIELLNKVQCDLTFMDIELKDGKSFEIFDQLTHHNFATVFTTAYDHYAFKAFKLEAVDYLLKPFSPNEVVKAVEKVAKNKIDLNEDFLNLLKSTTFNEPMLRLSTHEGLEIVNKQDIICCIADGSYCNVYVNNGHQVFVSKTLGKVSKQLDPTQFVRIHASALINLRYMKRYVKADGGSVEMSNGMTLPISRRRRQEFLEHLS